MPSTSKSQHRLMAAVAHNPSFAKKVGIPQSVGRDFTEADKGRKFAKGGDMAKKLPPFMGKESKAEEAKEMKIKRMSPALYKKGEKAEGVHGKAGKEKPSKYAKGGFTSAADGVAKHGKTKAQQFAMGGMPMMAQSPMAPAATGNPYQQGISQVGSNVGSRSPMPVGPRGLLGRMNQMRGQRMQSSQTLGRAATSMAPIKAGLTATSALPAAPVSTQGASGLQRVPGFGAPATMKKGGVAKTFAKGGGCELKGKTKGRMI